MFELSVASRYLIPRWRQLSTSIISSIAIGVIALVVWLIVVFFSVTDGLEKGWVNKLIVLTAPVRILPTDSYYQSYYYQIDSHSAASDYAYKSLNEKLNAPTTDPYDSTLDGEIPVHWPAPLRNADGSVADLVKNAVQLIKSQPQLPSLNVSDFETAVGTLRLNLIHTNHGSEEGKPSTLSYSIYMGALDPDNLSFESLILPIDPENRSPYLLKKISDQEGTQRLHLPSHPHRGEGILLPANFRESGVRLGDRGAIAYVAPTTNGMQEQTLPVYVSGFYDPGLLPIGGKFALVNPDVVRAIHGAQQWEGFNSGTGFNIRFDSYSKADEVKKKLQEVFEHEGIAPYWRIETYREFEFAKDFLQQLQSEKNLWSLISCIILIVACSNIISMLLILVNDKKLEIGILRAMGASSWSIAAIFGLCGLIIGIVGSAIGIVLALFTLRNLQTLIDFIGRMQGYELFNPLFYGTALPNTVSIEALAFVITATAAISLLAGLIPAIKACLVKPSTILRAE